MLHTLNPAFKPIRLSQAKACDANSVYLRFDHWVCGEGWLWDKGYVGVINYSVTPNQTKQIAIPFASTSYITSTQAFSFFTFPDKTGLNNNLVYYVGT